MAFSKARRLSDFIAADGTIPTGKFASGTITSAHIADTSITHADLHTDMNLTSKTVLVATASGSTNSTAVASTAFVQQELTTLIGGAPSTLNDLNELAAAINDDANYNSTLTTALATKLPLAGGTMSGALIIGGGGSLQLRPTDSSDTDAWILYQYTDDTLRYNFTGAGADEIIIKHPGSTNATTLTIDTANQSLGIGTASPARPLHINGTEGVARFTSTASGNSGLEVGVGTNSQAFMWHTENAHMEFATNNLERIRITANGDVLVGSSTNLNVLSGTPKIQIGKGDGHSSMQFFSGNSNVGALYFGDGTSGAGAVGTNGRYPGYIEYRHSNDEMAFRAGATTALSLNASRLKAYGNIEVETGKLLLGDSASHTSDLLQIETPASGGGHGIQIRRNDSNTDQGVGSITFGNNTATDLASISAKTDGATDNGALLFNTSVSGGANTERMRILSDGSIKHFSGAGILHLQGLGGSSNLIEGNGTIKIKAAGGAVDLIHGSAEVLNTLSDGIYTPNISIGDYLRHSGDTDTSIKFENDHIFFYTGGTRRIMIGDGGNITYGAHAYNSGSGVQTYGSTGRTFWDINYNSAGAEILLINNRTANGVASVLQYRTNGVVEGSLYGSSTGLAISNVSDYRKKENIRDLTGSLNVIKSLQPRVYEYRDGFGTEGDHIGFIAHEIQAHIPKAVTGDKDELYTQTDIDEGASEVIIGEPKYQAVSYTHNELITRLVQSIQELEARIAVLEG